MMATKAQKTDNKIEQTFTKDQILKSIRFSEHVDLVSIVLDSDKEYTLEQVNDALEALKGGK